MYKKILNISFITAFMLMLIIPLALTNWKGGGVSETENRTLASFPSIKTDEGDINTAFTTDMEKWLGDNIGFREKMVYANARISYNIFGRLESKSYMLGPGGELNFVDDRVMANFQHTNLLDENTLKVVTDSFQTVNDYLESRGIQFYYIQMWDKQSIYPESFPASIYSIGDISLTDQVVAALRENTSVKVISTKELMLEGKQSFRTYNKCADVTHWSQQGAFMGYRLIMDTINANNNGRFKVLTEDDYDITMTDQGNTILGGIHFEEYAQDYKLKEPHAYQTPEKFTLYKDADYRQTYWTNDDSDNDIKVLICGDSYIYSFFIDDMAESFKETIELWAWTSGDIINVINEYKPDILIYEKAEREPAFACDMVWAAEKIKEEKK
ncbi:MAG: hypothetical protein IKO30_08635 [Lachnospiraceae bacterium]|nr:hypothetical protein [Lachnospiraceae bacterium]